MYGAVIACLSALKARADPYYFTDPCLSVRMKLFLVARDEMNVFLIP